MFDSILIRPNSNEGVPMDFGQVIENLFFYQKTVVHINRGSVPLLLKLADVDVLVELLKYQGLQILYNNSMATVGIPGDGTYWVDTIGLADFDIEKELFEEAMRSGSDEVKARKFAKKLSRLIGVYELPYAVKGTLIEQLHDNDFLKIALDETLKLHYPGINIAPGDRRYELEFINGRNFKVHTNITGSEAVPFHDNSPILSLINAAVDLYLMAESESEICLPEFNSRILRQKVNTILDKSEQSAEKISRFHLAQFNEARAIREAINNKQLHVKAVLPVLRKANRFKEWLYDLPGNHDLMYEYMEKMEEKSVLERIGFKDMRFYFFTGLQTIISAMQPMASLFINPVLSAFDAYLLDQLTKDWKPSQFVRDDYQKLLND